MNVPNLDNASDEIKLAVDIIYLLESHQIHPDIVLKALSIVQQDYQQKKDKLESAS